MASEAATLLLTARLAVAVLPFAVIRPVLGVRTTSAASAREPSSAGTAVVRCCRAVAAARRRMPVVSTCLADAITGQLMLRRRHVPSTIVFGLARRDGEWCNHAWLEVDGRTVLGGPGTDAYTRVVEYATGSTFRSG